MRKIALSFAFATFILSQLGNCQINVPSGFKAEMVGTVDKPVSMAFIPDGRILLARQDGYMYVFANGSLLPSPILQLDSIYWGNEKGFLGIAVDPDFKNNGHIYCYYTINVRYNIYNGFPLNNNNTIRHKIARYTMSGNTIVPGSKKSILDMDVTNGNFINVNHDGGQMQFGPDGKLYLVTGEGDLWCPCFTPHGSSCDWSCNACTGRSQPSCVSYQWADNWNSFFGKIIRLNNDGSAPQDNPYYNSPTPVYEPQKYIYARGFRNPFTMHFRPGTSDIYVNDVGSHNQSAREEVNRVTPAGGKHFGWPSVEGSTTGSNYVNPVFYYGHCANLPNCTIKSGTVVGCGITGGVFYTATGTNSWPAIYNNKYFYMDFCNGYINVLDVDNNNAVFNFATGLANNVGNSVSGIGALFLEVGPDGQMYYLARSLSAATTGLYRISYQPVSVTSVSINQGSFAVSTCGGSVALSASVSPANATISDVMWSIRPSSLAGITPQGVFHAIGNGIVTITAISVSDFNIRSSITATLSGQNPVSLVSISGPGGNPNPVIDINKGSVQLFMSYSGCSGISQGIGWEIVKESSQVVTSITSGGLLQSLGGNGTVTVSGYVVGDRLKSKNLVVQITNQSVPVTSINLTASALTFNPNIHVITVSGNVLPNIALNKQLQWTLSSTGVSFTYQTISGQAIAVSVTGFANQHSILVRALSVENSSITASVVLYISNQIPPVSLSIFASTNTPISATNNTVTLTGVFNPFNTSNQNVIWQMSKNTPSVTLTTLSGKSLEIRLNQSMDDTLEITAVSAANNTLSAVVTLFIYAGNIAVLPSRNPHLGDIHLYPNPSGGKFYLSSVVLGGQITATFYNEQGQMVYSKNITHYKNIAELDITHLQRGYYLLVVGTQTGAYRFKILYE